MITVDKTSQFQNILPENVFQENNGISYNTEELLKVSIFQCKFVGRKSSCEGEFSIGF